MGKWTPEQHAKFTATMDRKRKRQRNTTTKITTKRNTPTPLANPVLGDGTWGAIVKAQRALESMTLPQVADVRANAEKRNVIGKLYRWCNEIIAAD